MTEPSVILLAAADRLRDLAADAAPGPWAADGNRVTTEDRDWNPVVGEGLDGGGVVDVETARWIAALSPATGVLIEAVLRDAARQAALAAAMNGPHSERYAESKFGPQLALARALVADLVGDTP